MNARAGFADLPQASPVSGVEAVRLDTAVRLAAGMLANPNCYQQRAWKEQVTRDSVELADQLITRIAGGL